MKVNSCFTVGIGMPRVRYLMSSPVVTIRPDATVYEAIKVMAEKRIGSLVVTENEEIKGIFTERDLISRVLAKDLDPKKTTVKEVMTPAPLVTIDPDAEVSEAALLMVRRRIRRLPVIEDGKLVGIITAADLYYRVF